MTPESIRMSDLIMDAAGLCEQNGHSMDWQRYSNFVAESDCRNCKTWVMIRVNAIYEVSGTALDTKCKGGGK